MSSDQLVGGLLLGDLIHGSEAERTTNLKFVQIQDRMPVCTVRMIITYFYVYILYTYIDI